jgi:hypothetical protein
VLVRRAALSKITDIDEPLDDGYDIKSWLIGNDSDCDTCGWSYNEAEFDPHFHDENKWQFWYRAGCYGGNSVSFDDDNREQKLNQMFEDLKTYPGWPRRADVLVRKMIEVCDKLREKK